MGSFLLRFLGIRRVQMPITITLMSKVTLVRQPLEEVLMYESNR